MIEHVPDNAVLEKCTKDILSLIRPEEDDRNKRQSAIQELEMSIKSVAALSGAAAKPFGSFLSNLYSKSGDLDLSVQLANSSDPPISKKKKQSVLREVRKALQKGGVAGYMEFIPHARVPVLQYVSNRFGISCDLSVDNYSGRIKSKIFYWISTIDERFGNMVLVIKEWAKAQNINDPKNGTLNSYSLCLLVLYHFQTCEPAILPPLKDIYEGNITEDFADMTLYDEEHLDEVCAANIAKFGSENKEQRNESSLCYLLTTFFDKFCKIDAISSDVICTYTGKLEKIEDNPNRRRKKSYSLFVEDPVERPDNAARAVRDKGLLLIACALKDTNLKLAALDHSERDDLLAMLCTPAVCSKLGGRVVANTDISTSQKTRQHARPARPKKQHDNQRQRHQGAKGFTGSRPVQNPTQVVTDTAGRHQGAKGFTGSRPVQNPTQVVTETTGRQTPGQYRDQDPQFYTNTTGHQQQTQRVQYQNHYHPSAQAHQATGLYQNQYHPQAYTPWAQPGVPYQNHNYQQGYIPGYQAAGSYQYQPYTGGAQTQVPYQYQSQSQGHIRGPQTPGSYPYQSQPRVPSTVPQTTRPYQNGYRNQQQMLNAGTGVYYQNQGSGGQYTPDRYTNRNNRNGVTPRYEPVAGGLQNGPPRDSRSQASSSRTEWQGSSQHRT